MGLSGGACTSGLTMVGGMGSSTPFGGLAQLGEHLLCKQGVVGSIPSTSINAVCLAGDRDRCGFACVTAVGRGVGGSCRVFWSFIHVNQVLVRLWARRATRFLSAAGGSSDLAVGGEEGRCP
jgi:hypothetical protein